MLPFRNALHLGASLYVPADRSDLQSIVQKRKLADVRSIIFCLEDSVSPNDLPLALERLREALPQISEDGRMFFVRPRNVEVLDLVLAMPGVEALTGFVIPKATAASLPDYLSRIVSAERANPSLAGLLMMPTLETKEVFVPEEMARLHDFLVQPTIRERILSLRIGGNDLFNVLGLRRSRHRTLYESPLGPVIAQLVAQFKPSGFNLSSPVCEHLYDYEVLERELIQDVEFGLFGKTAIHPDQVPVIEKYFKPSEQDFRMAQAILAPNAPAVFNMYGTMCEVATHHRWALQIMERAQVYGVFGKDKDSSLAKRPTYPCQDRQQ